MKKLNEQQRFRQQAIFQFWMSSYNNEQKKNKLYIKILDRTNMGNEELKKHKAKLYKQIEEVNTITGHTTPTTRSWLNYNLSSKT